ncbi:MAG: hypothetical protein P8Q97_08945 [Myxococcota bacterium]|nr:hypothetical protein [Myxococcota bacterium]
MNAELSIHGLPDEGLIVASTPEHYGLIGGGVLGKLDELLAS